jgi:LysM repeat protein
MKLPNIFSASVPKQGRRPVSRGRGGSVSLWEKVGIKAPPQKKLRASTSRRSIAAADEMDYEEMSEPNMKLSRALLIVLVLHVVAVAGIIAFNTIKSRQGAFPQQQANATTVTKTEPTVPKAEPVAPAAVAAVPSVAPRGAESKVATSVAKPAAKDEPIKAALPVNRSASDDGKFYVVAKGDNPVSIARKLKVSESDLLAVNHIDDPRKLQIGQKLIVPQSKAAKGKKSD